MEELEQNLTAGALHHAYFIEGARERVLPEILSFIEEKLKMPVRGNPEVLVVEYQTFGIDEGRFLQTLEGFKVVGGHKKVFVICFDFLTREAQNAFLKLFEEPLPGTHFFLISPSAEVLLPTLRSRLQVLPYHGVAEKNPLVKKFLAAHPAKRIALFKGLIDERDRVGLIAFLNELETELHATQPIDASSAPLFETIEKVRSYLGDTGPMLKMLFEHLSLSIPVR